jgi:hypothetical protein
MPDYLIWPILIIVVCGSYFFGILTGARIGIRIEGRHWRQRCNDTLTAVEATKSYEKKAMPQTPGGCEPQTNPQTNPQAWKTYTLAELGWWVHLIIKRAEHRLNHEERAKDLLNAENYLSMMQAKLEEARLRAHEARSERTA